MDIYNKKYIGKLWISKLDPVGYCIKLGMNTPDAPSVIYAELEDEKFLKFLRQELKNRRFHLSYFGSIQRDYPVDCNPINRACSCNDKK